MTSPDTSNSLEIVPHLLYCVEGAVAMVATWRLVEGHEAVALFSSEAAVEKYRAELAEPAQWLGFQPSRDKLIDILQACRSAGILYAALDPASGGARTLFDLPKVLEAGQGAAVERRQSGL